MPVSKIKKLKWFKARIHIRHPMVLQLPSRTLPMRMDSELKGPIYRRHHQFLKLFRKVWRWLLKRRGILSISRSSSIGRSIKDLGLFHVFEDVYLSRVSFVVTENSGQWWCLWDVNIFITLHFVINLFTRVGWFYFNDRKKYIKAQPLVLMLNYSLN